MPNDREHFKQRIQSLIKDECVTTESGYKVWWPSTIKGYYSAESLRCMADCLDEMNKEWDEQIDRDLGPK